MTWVKMAPCLAACMAAAVAGAVELPPGVTACRFIYDAAPFPQCHASTIVQTASGRMVAAWFGGTQEKHPDVEIYVARLQGEQWTAPQSVANGAQADGLRHPCWNPVLFQPAGGPLMLFYKVGPSPQTWWGMLRTSTDDGATWSPARRLPDGVLGPIKNKPVQMPDGAILCPSSTETDAKPSAWRVHFEKTADLGGTWSTARPAASPDGKAIDAIQPSILFHGGGRLQALGRSRSGKIFETWSNDSGASWSALALTALPNPNSGTDAVTLRDGRHLLIYNHTARGRSPLNLAVSRDGRAWEAAGVLENTPGKEFSYPAIIQTTDGLVHIVYTWQRQKVRHVVVDPGKLQSRPMIDGALPQ
jgi:predicted neuraminidase